VKLPLRNLWAEFKTFAFKGNMIELAVAVVIGGAFSNVIHAFVTDVINPSISYAVSAARQVKETSSNIAHEAALKVGATSQPSTEPTSGPTTLPATEPAAQSVTQPATQPAAAATSTPAGTAPAAPAPAPKSADDSAKAVQFEWMVGRFPVGHLIGELLNFLIIAFAVFILIVKFLGGTMKRLGSKPAEPTEPTTKECPECLSTIPYRAKRCSQCTSVQPPLETLVKPADA